MVTSGSTDHRHQHNASSGPGQGRQHGLRQKHRQHTFTWILAVTRATDISLARSCSRTQNQKWPSSGSKDSRHQHALTSGGGTGHTHWHGFQQSFKTWTFAWFSLSPQGTHCSIPPFFLQIHLLHWHWKLWFITQDIVFHTQLFVQILIVTNCWSGSMSLFSEALFLPSLGPLPHPPYIHPYNPFISLPLFSLILNKFTEDHYMDLHYKLWLHKTQVPAPTKRHNNSMTERHNIWCNC